MNLIQKLINQEILKIEPLSFDEILVISFSLR